MSGIKRYTQEELDEFSSDSVKLGMLDHKTQSRIGYSLLHHETDRIRDAGFDVTYRTPMASSLEKENVIVELNVDTYDPWLVKVSIYVTWKDGRVWEESHILQP